MGRHCRAVAVAVPRAQAHALDPQILDPTKRRGLDSRADYVIVILERHGGAWLCSGAPWPTAHPKRDLPIPINGPGPGQVDLFKCKLLLKRDRRRRWAERGPPQHHSSA